MKYSNRIVFLSALVACLAGIAAETALFSKVTGTSFEFTTLRGQTAQIYGQGLYHYDTVFFGAGYKGQDVVALFVGLPLMILALVLYSRESLGGHVLLTGVLGYFLYLYASMALGAAYNPLFLLYILIFSASLFSFILVFTSVDLRLLASRITAEMPQRGLVIFMIAAGLITLLVWGGPLVSAMLRGGAPDRMDSYTTMVTCALDLAILTPATFLCAWFIRKGNPLGYLMASPLLTLVILLAPQIVLSTIFQRDAGVSFTMAEMIGPASGFVVLGVLAFWFLVRILGGLHRPV